MTPAARSVLGFAAAEAAGLNRQHLGTEHILLGLLREANSDAAQILASHADLKTVRACVGKATARALPFGTRRTIRWSVDEDVPTLCVGVGSESPHEQFPLTPRAAEVLRLARREADMYGETHIAPEHLLLGFLREGEGRATQVFLELRVDFGTVRAAASRSLWQDQAPAGTLPPDEPQDG